MPELSTILTVTSAVIVVAVVVIIIALSKRRHKDSTKNDSTSEIVASTAELTQPVDSISHPERTTDGKEPSESISSVDTDPNMVETEQGTTETTIDPKDSPEPIIVDLPEPSRNPAANGLSEAESTTEPSSLVRNDEPESELELPAKPGRKVSPENRGGARRGKRTKEAEEPTSDKKQRVRKPELVCWQQSRKWFLGVETPTENGETSGATAAQANVQLTRVSNSRWPILNLFETITITTLPTNENYNLQLAERQRPFLLFKLSGENLNSGRRVRYATAGVYLIVAPQDWIRDEKQSGIPQLPPSLCHLPGFQAHYFHLDSTSNERIAFLTPENEEIQIPNSNSRFDLEGCKIGDASYEMGPLFAQNPPSLAASDSAIWKDVETIVIGEEGKSSNGWRTPFKPDIKDARVNLFTYLQGKEAGWFFLRIYDSNDELIDSLDFRFARDLHTIRIGDHNILPNETGHTPARITLECDDSSSYTLLPNGHDLKPVNVNETKIEIDIPPRPEYDRTEWAFVSSAKARVNISFLVERVWWIICKRDTPIEQSEWQDKSLTLKADHLKATSDYILRIRLPKSRWTREVHIGFERGRSRTYPVEVTKRVVDIPLNHLEGVSQIEDSSKDHSLFLWLDDFPEQVIAILAREQKKRKKTQLKSKTPIRLNLNRLLKYLNHLDRRVKDASLSILLNECKRKWSSSGIREHRDTYLIETACVIALSWKLLKVKRMKVIGRRKGWIRYFIKIANSNSASFSSIVEKYQALTDNDKAAA